MNVKPRLSQMVVSETAGSAQRVSLSQLTGVMPDSRRP